MASVLLDDDFLTLLELDFAFDELDFATLDDEDTLVEDDDDFAALLELDSAFDELDFATLDDDDVWIEDDDDSKHSEAFSFHLGQNFLSP